MPDDNVKNGKLLTVNAGDGNFPSDYEYRLREHTKTDMYYTYIEALIPTKYLNKDDTDPIRFNIGDNQVWLTTNLAIYHDETDFLLASSNDFEEYAGLLDKEYLVLSIMVLPKINKNLDLNIDGSSVYYNSVVFFLNGEQVIFNCNNPSSSSDFVYFLTSSSLFYESEENVFLKLELIGDQYTGTGYIIWNTEYERFMYKELANMCYERSYRQLTKQYEIDGTNKFNEPLTPIRRSTIPSTSNFFVSNNELKIYDLFSNANIGDIVYYIETTIDINTLKQDSVNSFGIYLYNTYKDTFTDMAEYNEFDSIYKNSNSTLNEYYWQNDPSINGNFSTDGILNATITFNSASDSQINFEASSASGTLAKTQPYTINISSNDDKLYIVFYAVKESDTELQMYIGAASGNSSSDYKINITNSIDYFLYTINDTKADYSYSLFSYNYSNYIEDINMGYTRYHTYVDTPSTLSLNNARWKTMMKYNRTITFTTYLQDNPAILPLELFTSMEDNMYVEIDAIEIGNGEFAIGSGMNFYDRTDNEKLKSIENGFYVDNLWNDNIKYFKNGTSSDIDLGSMNLVDFALQYNSKTKKLKLLSPYAFGTAKEYTIDITSDEDLKVLSSIMVHLYPMDGSQDTAGYGLGTFTINFGPISGHEELQPYIDELLQQDVKPTIKYHNQNIFKNHNFHTTQELVAYFGYDSDTNGIAGYDKGVWY